MFKYLGGLLITLVLGSSAYAQCGGSYGYCAPRTAYRQTYTPVYNNYYDNYQTVDIIQKRVIFDGRYFLGLDGYYSVGQDYGCNGRNNFQPIVDAQTQTNAKLDQVNSTLNQINAKIG